MSPIQKISHDQLLGLDFSYSKTTLDVGIFFYFENFYRVKKQNKNKNKNILWNFFLDSWFQNSWKHVMSSLQASCCSKSDSRSSKCRKEEELAIYKIDTIDVETTPSKVRVF